MSVATPTLIPRPPHFPRLLPPAPRVLPQPLKRRTSYGNFNGSRDLQKQLDDLSDEEAELEEQNTVIHTRGFSSIVPVGRSLTQKEEKADAGEDDDDGPSSSDEGSTEEEDEDGDDDEDDDDDDEGDLGEGLDDLDDDMPDEDA